MARLGVVIGLSLGLQSMTLPSRAQARDSAEPGEPFAIAVHARTARASARAEQAAWLSLTLPLSRLAEPRASLSSSARAVAQQSDTTTDTPARHADVDAGAQPEPPPIGFAQLRALTAFARRAVAIASGVAGVAADRRRLEGLSSRARASAALPELRLRAQRNTDQALRWAPTNDDPYRVTQADGAGTVLEASATFRLDRLLFSREELVVERLHAQAGAERLELERRVLSALLGLFRARELACVSDADESARTLQQVKVVELFAELDQLTGGWFSAQAPGFGRAIWGFPEALLGWCLAPEASEPVPSKSVASLEDSE